MGNHVVGRPGTLLRVGDAALDPEPRWPAFIAVLAVGGIYTGLPEALTLGPRWLFPSLVLTLLIPTVASASHSSTELNSILGFLVGVLLTVGLVISVVLLIGALPTRKESPLALLLPPLRYGLPTFWCLLCGIGGWMPADRTNEISARDTRKDRSCFRR